MERSNVAGAELQDDILIPPAAAAVLSTIPLLEAPQTRRSYMRVNLSELARRGNFRGLHILSPDDHFARVQVGGRGEFGGIPASRYSINALETRIFEGIQGRECVVCLEDFEVGVEVTAMPCSHEFHRTCLGQWLQRSHLCPLCRFPMPTMDSLS